MAIALSVLLGAAACTQRELAPMEAASTTRSADGVPIRYDVRGASEVSLVLIHGWTNSRRIWGEHPRTLSRTHRVVTLDLAGHGESGADRDRWTMEAFGQDVVAVVEDLGLSKVVLVGFSMGGAVALEAARLMPNRVVGVVLVDSYKDPDAVPPDSLVDIMEQRFRASWKDTAFLRAFAFTPDAPDSLVQYVADISAPQPADHWFPILRETFRWAREDGKNALASVDAPIAAINTTLTTTNVEAFRRHSPSFTLDTFQGVGHAGILLQRVEDFDATLLAIVERFAAGR
jgi:pimeloyl-ACP methyl ester carboxylesterase